jgi:hypothetical protein
MGTGNVSPILRPAYDYLPSASATLLSDGGMRTTGVRKNRAFADGFANE